MSLKLLLKSELDKEFEALNTKTNKKTKGILKKKSSKKAKKTRSDAFLSDKERKERESLALKEGIAALLATSSAKVSAKAGKAIEQHTAKTKRQVKEEAKDSKDSKDVGSVFTEEDFSAWEKAPFINSEIGGPKKKLKKTKKGAKKAKKPEDEEF